MLFHVLVKTSLWVFLYFVVGHETLYIFQFITKFSTICLCFFRVNIIFSWNICVRRISFVVFTLFYFNICSKCTCTPFVWCCTDLYTWALILLWSNIAGHMLDLYSSPLYPFVAHKFEVLRFIFILAYHSIFSWWSSLTRVTTSDIHWNCKVFILFAIILFLSLWLLWHMLISGFLYSFFTLQYKDLHAL